MNHRHLTIAAVEKNKPMPTGQKDDNIDDMGRPGDGKVLDQPGTEEMPDPETIQPNDAREPSRKRDEPATDKG